MGLGGGLGCGKEFWLGCFCVGGVEETGIGGGSPPPDARGVENKVARASICWWMRQVCQFWDH